MRKMIGRVVEGQVRNHLAEGRKTDGENAPLLVESFFSRRNPGTLILKTESGQAIFLSRTHDGSFFVEIGDNED